jgi:hypothetical protein
VVVAAGDGTAPDVAPLRDRKSAFFISGVA